MAKEIKKEAEAAAPQAEAAKVQSTEAPKAEPVKKTAAKRTAAAAAKKAEPAKKAESQRVDEVVVQFGGSEWSVDAIKDSAVAAYAAEGHRASSVKKLTLYVKPEDRKAYYVINDKTTGSVEL